MERKKNGQIKGLISNMWLILCYTAKLVIPNLFTKFDNLVIPNLFTKFDNHKSSSY